MEQELALNTGGLARQTSLSHFLTRAGAAISSAAAAVALVWWAATERASSAWFAAQSNDFRLKDPR
jgi:hypothetical protein